MIQKLRPTETSALFKIMFFPEFFTLPNNKGDIILKVNQCLTSSYLYISPAC